MAPPARFVAVVALDATIEVLHPKPVFVVHISAEDDELHPPTESAVTFAVPDVEFPRTVLVADCASIDRGIVFAPATVPVNVGDVIDGEVA